MAEIERELVTRLIDHAGDPAGGVPPEGVCVPCPGFIPNQAMVRLFAADDAADLQQRIRETIPVDRIPDLIRLGRAALAGDPSEATIPMVKADGRQVVIRLEAYGPPESNQPLLLAATEVTGSTELHRQLNMLALLPEWNPNLVFVVDGETDVAYLNPAARRWAHEHGMDAAATLQALSVHLQNDDTPAGGDQTWAVDHEDGRRYSVHVVSVAGTGKRMVTVSDVTEQTRLRAEHDLFKMAFNATTNPMVITDSAGRIEHVNAAFTRYYGFTAEEASGRNPRILNPGRATYRDLGVSDDQYDRLFAEMWEALSADGRYETELVNQSINGTVSWMKVVLTKIVLGQDLPHKYLGVHVDVEAARRREEATRLEVFRTVARVGELRDNETGRHMRRVGLYSRRLAETLGMPAKYCMDIENQAPLHDIGKVGISDTILLAPRKLSPEEFEIIERHTTLGYSILADAPSMEMAADIALGHHEKHSGNGYPFGLAGPAIPLAARIVALVDVYDALRSERPYKQAWDHATTTAEIMRQKNVHFCPDVVAAFGKIESDFREISSSYTD